MPHTFTTAPQASGEQRKFVNPTPGFVGANVFGGDGKPTAIAVEPGGEVWLTPAEERMTAEAPRLAENNPFVAEWQEPVEWDPTTGEGIRFVPRQGMLVLTEDPPRPLASSRYIPERGSADDLRRTREAMQGLAEPAPARDPEPEPETITGAPPLAPQPSPQGQPSPDEVVGTPEAPARNDEALAVRAPTAEQPTSGAIPT
jgi:hypothetical protein